MTLEAKSKGSPQSSWESHREGSAGHGSAGQGRVGSWEGAFASLELAGAWETMKGVIFPELLKGNVRAFSHT